MQLSLLNCLFLTVLQLVTGAASSAPVSDTIFHGDECYPAVFEPTHEFRAVRADQAIPAGLHVRLNMETGAREAKLLTDEPDENLAMVVVHPEDGAQLISVEAPPSSLTPEPAQHHKPNARIPIGDFEVFEDAVSKVMSPKSSTSDVTSAFAALEDLAHEIDFGIKLVEKTTLTRLVEMLSHASPQIRSNAALILGSALRNNPHAQSLASSTLNLVHELVQRFSEEAVGEVKARLVYALSAAVGGEVGRREWRGSGGDRVLGSVFRESAGGSEESGMLGKVAVFVEDNIVHEAITESPRNVAMGKQEGMPAECESRMRQEEWLGIWCTEFQRALLTKPLTPDTRHKLFHALTAIKRTSPNVCETEIGFLEWLSEHSVQAVGEAAKGDEFLEVVKETRGMRGNGKAGRKFHHDTL
ncbi:nucleotide exchange factor sil1 [Saitoella coloradoensis]